MQEAERIGTNSLGFGSWRIPVQLRRAGARWNRGGGVRATAGSKRASQAMGGRGGCAGRSEGGSAVRMEGRSSRTAANTLNSNSALLH